MESGTALNFLMVKLGPRTLTSSEYIILIRDPSGSAPSAMGLEMLTGLPMRSAMRSTYLSSSSSEPKLTLVGTALNFLWMSVRLDTPMQ